MRIYSKAVSCSTFIGMSAQCNASLAVAKTARGQGVAMALMHEVEQRAVEAGYRVISLEVESKNAAALQLYLKLGYQVVGRDDDARRLEGDLFFGRSVKVSKLRLEKALGGHA